MALVVKNLPAHAGDIRVEGSIPGLGRSPGRGHGNPLQYSCVENPMDRGAWQATVHGVTKVGQDSATKPPIVLSIILNMTITFSIPREMSELLKAFVSFSRYH